MTSSSVTRENVIVEIFSSRLPGTLLRSRRPVNRTIFLMKAPSIDVLEGHSVAREVPPCEKYRRRRSIEGEEPSRKRFCNSRFNQTRRLSDDKTFTASFAPGTPNEPMAASIWAHVEIEDVVNCWQRLAQQGCPHSQYSLGLCFEKGHGVKHDMRAAAQLWKSAAEAGHARSQYELGRCYEKGAGIERDPILAIRWWREAAAQGLADAQHKMGIAFELGEHIPKDLDHAVRMFRLAASQDHPGAQFELARCWEEGLGLPKDKDEANRLFRLAAIKGHLLARMSALYT